MKAFIDTNVWFSAFYGSANCQAILVDYTKGKFEAIISRTVVRELTKNLGNKFPKGLDLVGKFLALYPPEMVESVAEVSLSLRGLADAKDLPILQEAYNAKVKYFVTGNIKDFDVVMIKKKLNIQVISPSDFVKLL